MKQSPATTILSGIILMLAGSTPAAHTPHGAIIPDLPASPTLVVSTIPANGDLNPYGLAVVPHGFLPGGALQPDDFLVSNFNNSSNLQGTGTTIVRVTPAGQTSLFFQGPAGLGLTLALGVLKNGFVVVGSVPTLDGTSGTIQQGSLLIIDRFGNTVEVLTDSTLLDGPWGLTVFDEGDHGALFVANVLSGTVTRIDLQIPDNANPVVVSETQIASGYLHRPDPAALVVGPTGLLYDRGKDVLYVAATGDNEIFVIPDAKGRATDAGTGNVIYQDNAHLRGPLGLLQAPNGDLLTSNGDAVNPDPTQPSEIVEFTVTGKFIAQVPIDQSPDGAFQIALERFRGHLRFAAVDDNTNALQISVID